MMYHGESWWFIIMKHHAALKGFLQGCHCPFCRGRIFAMTPMAFFQAKTLKMEIVAAQGEPQNPAKCSPPGNFFTLSDIMDKYTADTVRVLSLSVA